MSLTMSPCYMAAKTIRKMNISEMCQIYFTYNLKQKNLKEYICLNFLNLKLIKKIILKNLTLGSTPAPLFGKQGKSNQCPTPG